jgi:hypothetical protein
MGLFDFLKKGQAPAKPLVVPGPYSDAALNHVYQLLFCDKPEWFGSHQEPPYTYPFDVLLSPKPDTAGLVRIVNDNDVEPRLQLLAYNILRSSGKRPSQKILLGVIIEVGLEGGLDVLASYRNGTARYINQSGKLIIWENTEDAKVNELTATLFEQSWNIVNQIGPWDKPRRPHPPKNNLRISFLVSDGLYFGEGGMNVLFNDPMAAPALNTATALMQYLMANSLEKENGG